MFSVFIKHMSQSGKFLVSRQMGAAGGGIKPTSRHFNLAMQYTVHEENGSSPYAVQTKFPSGKYSDLGYTPTWAHHRFCGWYESASTPTTSAPSGTTILPTDKVVYAREHVYARWQLPASITFDATTNGGSMPGGWSSPDYYVGQTYGTLPTPTHPTLNFAGWYDGNTLVTSDTIIQSASKTLVATYAAQSYSVDISNGDWVLQSPNTNPDSTTYEGVYQSDRYHGSPPSSGCVVKMYIDVIGYTTFTVYIRSYAENGWSYTIALNPDVDPSTYNDAISASKADTSSSATGTTSISGYTRVDYSLDGGSHRICIAFIHKDSYTQNDDRGYVLIPRQQ